MVVGFLVDRFDEKYRIDQNLTKHEKRVQPLLQFFGPAANPYGLAEAQIRALAAFRVENPLIFSGFWGLQKLKKRMCQSQPPSQNFF